jgi:NAD(P)-dependent dehydrogenase (short-subunit alcohol dehydrogenase family)
MCRVVLDKKWLSGGAGQIVYFHPATCLFHTPWAWRDGYSFVNMKKKIFLITGTNSGFGWPAANSCARPGHTVVVVNNAGVIAEYGGLAAVPEQIRAGIGQLFEAMKPNPQLVADAIVALMDTPKGKRLLRTVVDPATGDFSEIANKRVKEQYDYFLTAFGMQAMLA